MTVEQITQLSEIIEDDLRLLGSKFRRPTSPQVLDRLRGLDEVAHLRFASVYKGFDEAARLQTRNGAAEEAAALRDAQRAR